MTLHPADQGFLDGQARENAYNQALHIHLLAHGYEHERVEASWEDHGDAETGPMVSGGPAYDMYLGPDEVVFATEDGLLDRISCDVAFEKALEAFMNDGRPAGC